MSLPNGSSQPCELPQGWDWATLASACSIGSKQVVPREHPRVTFNYVALENIEQGSGRLIGFTPTEGSEIGSNKYTFSHEHVLFGKLRPYLRKVLVPDFDGISATDLLPIKPDPDRLDRRFLAQWLLSPYILEYVVSRQTGVKMPRLRTGDLEKMPVPLPPLPEQQRLVERIERLLEQSRTAREALDRIPPLLKRFRQSVLAKAFRGELTERDPNDEPASMLLERIREERRRKWEEDLHAKGKDPRKAKYVETEPLDAGRRRDLPEGWVWATVREIGTEMEQAVKCGPFGSQLPSREFQDRGVPILAIGNVQWAGLRPDAQDFVSEEKAAELQEYLLRTGDVVFTRSGTVGRSIVIPPEADGWLMSYHLLRVRVNPAVCHPQYLYLVFRGSEEVLGQVTETARGATRPGFNIRSLTALPVPLAPVAEQMRIIAKVSSVLAEVDAIEVAAALAHRRAEQVDDAVLARAFRGEL